MKVFIVFEEYVMDDNFYPIAIFKSKNKADELKKHLVGNSKIEEWEVF